MLKICSTFTSQMMLIFQEKGFAIEMADKLRANGKIYVVVAIICIILLGVLLYLISLDKKISKLEQSQKK